MELRVRSGRAVLASRPAGPGDAVRETEPQSPPLDDGLVTALREWAQVADVVERGAEREDRSGAGGGTGALVSRRGRQLALRVATAVGKSVHYVDPVSGEVQVIDVPGTQPDVGAPSVPAPAPEPAEPTPWATGSTLAAITAAVVCYVVLALSTALAQSSTWLAFAADVVIAAGLAPSVWLGRNAPVWRWVAYGVVVGMGLAWVALLLGLL